MLSFGKKPNWNWKSESEKISSRLESVLPQVPGMATLQGTEQTELGQAEPTLATLSGQGPKALENL